MNKSHREQLDSHSSPRIGWFCSLDGETRNVCGFWNSTKNFIHDTGLQCRTLDLSGTVCWHYPQFPF